MALDISRLNETQLSALMVKIQAPLNELAVEKAARIRDKVIAIGSCTALDRFRFRQLNL